MTVIPACSAPLGMPPAHAAGAGALLALIGGADRPLPLQGVTVRADIVGGRARTTLRQRYVNSGMGTVDVVYIFPLPPGGALTALSLRVGDRVVAAELQAKIEAERVYTNARAEGKLAGLLSQERADVHTLRLGGLPAGASVEVEVEVEERLHAEDGALWWRFPTVLAPRYTPGEAVGHSGDGVSPDTDVVPDASRISPPIRLGSGARLDLEVRVFGPVLGVASSLPGLSIGIEEGSMTLRPGGPMVCDRDLIVRVVPGSVGAAPLLAWTDGRFTEVVLSPTGGAAARTMPRDAVFLLDISGSMEGQKMVAAKFALQTAIRALSPGDRMHLVAFDDRIERWQRGPVAVDDAQLKAAEAWIARQQARGGTELLPALQEALAQAPEPGRLRTVLIITDGQSSDEHRLVPAVAHRRGATVVSTLGIDTAVNEALLRDLAEVGGGVCSTCTPDADIEAAVARVELAVGAPQALGVQVVGAFASEQVLYSGRTLNWVLEGARAEVEVVAADGRSWKVVAQPAPGSLAAAWAVGHLRRLRLRRLTHPHEAEGLMPEMTRASLLGRVVGPTTAWVVVDHLTQTVGPAEVVVQPVPLPAGWAGSAAVAPAPVSAMPMSPAPGAAVPVGARSAAPPPAAKLRKQAAAPPPPMERFDAEAVAEESTGAMPDMLAELSLEDEPAPAAPGFVQSAVASLGRAMSALKEAVVPPAPARPVPPARGGAVAAPARDEGEREESLSDDARRVAKRESAKNVVAEPLTAQVVAGRQAANGSLGDLVQTLIGLMVLLREGHTRQLGLRQRTVRRAVAWILAGYGPDPRVQDFLQLLESVEAGGTLDLGAWRRLRADLNAHELPVEP
jgi:Ca-activated chloride channel family protein